MTIEERLEKLEKELARGRRVNRWLLGALGLVLGAWVLAWVFAPGTARAQGTDAVPKIIRANQFLLVDENGNIRATLGVDKAGPSLSLHDENGKVRAGLIVMKNGSLLALNDENGNIRAGLSVTKVGPRLNLLDENGKNLWSAP